MKISMLFRFWKIARLMKKELLILKDVAVLYVGDRVLLKEDIAQLKIVLIIQITIINLMQKLHWESLEIMIVLWRNKIKVQCH